MLDMLKTYFESSGFGQFHWTNGLMILIGLLFIFLAIRKKFEPLLLIPIGFGILLGNIPYNVRDFSLGVYDGPISNEDLAFYAARDITIDGVQFKPMELVFSPMKELAKDNKIPRQTFKFIDLVERGDMVMVNSKAKLVYDGDTSTPGVKEVRQGRRVLVTTPAPDHRYNSVVDPQMQDPWNAGFLWVLFRGIEFGVFPPLIFLGIGALTDFGPLLSQPRTFLLGAAAQLGIFGALAMAVLLGFTFKEAGAIGIIGGADGPTSIFVCSRLAPDLLGAVALSAYSYMAMVPIIQPPIMRLLTTKKERLIRMEQPKEVSRTLKILFPIIALLLTAFIANSALALLGMLFLGNLLRESLVTERLAKTASSAMIDIVTILLGVSVGAKTQASNFLTTQTLFIFMLGIVAFSIATAGGVLFGKIMNKFSKTPINPLIGAAGVSAVPMSARVCQKVAQEEDVHNFILMHAMGPNVAGVIGSAVAAGVLLSYLNR